jgi:NAD(P)-dependent dehydrogenase (short-subunit alcohol dehydrogenase family)
MQPLIVLIVLALRRHWPVPHAPGNRHPRGPGRDRTHEGPIETPILGKTGLAGPELEAFRKDVARHGPLGRFGAAQEVAGAAAFLASPDASFITGTELAVDGGFAQV